MKIGLIISNDEVKHYEILELNNLIKSKHKITYIFSEKKLKEKNSNKFFLILKSIYKNKFFFLIFVEQKIASLLKKNSFQEKINNLEKKINIFDRFKSLRNVKKKYFKSKKINNKFSFDNEMKDTLKRNCDILILMGYNKILHHDVLKLTRYGILSFHTSDITRYRGRPAAFFEFINNEKYGGVSLQLLTNQLDGGKLIILRKIRIDNAKSYDETLYKMMSLKNNILISGINKINNHSKFFSPNNLVELSTLKKSRNIFNVYMCLKKTILKRYF